MLGVVAHVYNSSTGEAETRGLLLVRGQPRLHSVSKAQPVLHSEILSQKTKQTSKKSKIVFAMNISVEVCQGPFPF